LKKIIYHRSPSNILLLLLLLLTTPSLLSLPPSLLRLLTPRDEEDTVFLAPDGKRILVVPRSSSWATITAYPPEVRAKVPGEGGREGGKKREVCEWVN